MPLPTRTEATSAENSNGTIASAQQPLKTLLICHDDSALDREAVPRWLASFSTLAGIVVLRETT